jgi:hypothetical protein
VQTEQQEMQNMMRDMDQLFYNDWHFMYHEAFPFFVPVMVMPVQKITQPPKVSKQVTSTSSAATSQQNNVDNKTKI